MKTNKQKKDIFLALLLCSVLTFSVAAVGGGTSFAGRASSASSIESFDYDAAYQWAVDVGFSELFLRDISAEALKRVYDDNVGVENLIIFEVAGTHTFEEKTARGAIPESEMDFLKSAVVHPDENGYITDVRIYFTAKWKDGRPVYRYTDAIVSNWDANWIFKAGSFWGQLEDKHNNGGPTKVLESSTRASTQIQGGLGWHTKLSLSPLGYTPTVRIGYSLQPKSSTVPAVGTQTSSVTATYGHSYLAFSGINFTTAGPAVGMTGTRDEAGTAVPFEHGKDLS